MPLGGFRIEPLDTTGLLIPYHYRCPISLELMRDPVTVCTGQTYDRSSIESWVATGNTTCPVTRSDLTDFNLIPNHTLRRLIQEWCVAHRHLGVERIPTPKQPADPAHVRALLAQLSSDSYSPTHRLNALRRLGAFARDSEKNRSVILGSSANVGRVMLDVVFSGSGSGSGELGREAVAVLAAIGLGGAECEAVAGDPGRVGYFAGLLFDPSVGVRVDAAAVVEAVVSGTRSMELRYRVTSVDQVFVGVVGILRDGASYPRAVKVAVRALFTLCLVKQTRHKAVAAGAATALVDILAGAGLDKGDSERALATAELLCRLPEAGCAAFGGHALAVPVLVRAMLKVSDRATESAASALLSLCTAEERCRGEAVAAGVLTQLLLVVQSECSERAKKKAQMLLKLLQDSWPEYYSGGNSGDHGYGCSEVIPF